MKSNRFHMCFGGARALCITPKQLFIRAGDHRDPASELPIYKGIEHGH